MTDWLAGSYHQGGPTRTTRTGRSEAFQSSSAPALRCGEGPEGERNKQAGMQHLDVGDTRLLRQKARVQTTEANEGQVDMWSRAERHTLGERGRGRGKQPGSSNAKCELALSSVARCLVVAQWPRRRARPRFSQIELDPPCGAPNWDKGGWNNKAEPLDCPLTNGKASAVETARAVLCLVKG